MAEVLDSSKIPYAEKPQINDVCAAIVEYFGGMRKFVVRWGEEFEKAMDMYPGRIGNLQHFAKIVELIRDANRLDHDKDVAEMSDEQIRREQELLLIQMISEAASTGNQVKVVKNLCESLGLSPQEVLPQIGLEEEEDDGPA